MTQGTIACAVAALAVFAAISFLHLRHAGLALLVTISPLPGLALAHYGAALLGVAAPVLKLETLVAGFCLFGAEVLAASFVARIAEGESKGRALRATTTRAGAVFFLALIAAAIFVLAWPPMSEIREALEADLMLGGIAVLLLMPLGAFALPSGEDFIARANRAREWRERTLENISVAAFARWGFSIFGIGLVFAALAFFGAHLDAHHAPGQFWISLAIAGVAAAIASRIVARDWRRALALVLSLGFVALLGFWVFGGVPTHDTAQIAFSLALGMSFLPMLAMAAQHRRYAVLPEAANGAGAQAIVTIGSMVIFAALGVTGFFAVGVAAGFVALRVILIVLVGCVVALLLYPATCAVLETLLRRRVALDARYRLP